MKRIIFLAIVIMLSIGATMAQDFSVGDVGYSRSGANGGVKVWGASTAFAGGDFNIPTTVVDPADSKTYNVTEIRAYFVGKFDDAKRAKSITVPEGVVTMTAGENGSFDASVGGDGDSLLSLTLPSTLTNTVFGNFTFRSFPKLTSFTIKMATPPTVGANTFYAVNMSKLTIHIPAGKTQAYSDAGWNTTTWTGVTIVEEVPPGATVPDSPTITTVTSGELQAIVAFSAPSNDGGSPITSYTVTSNPGGITKSAPSSPIYVTGLTNGTAYTFTVIATNAVGNSAPSVASAEVVPVSLRVLPSVTTQLLSICQPTKTYLHMTSSVDSMKYDSGTDEIVIYKKTGLTYTYARTDIDSIVLVDGSSWSDSLKVALDVTRYSVVGDGVTNNKDNLRTAFTEARNANANLYFPNGIYFYNGSLDAPHIRFIGQSRTNTIIKDTLATNEHHFDGADNITFQNFKVSDYGTSLTRTFKNCIFHTTLPVSGSYIQMYSGAYTLNADHRYIDCDFIFPQIWVGLLIRKYHSVFIDNCYFNGHATHNIRLESPYSATSTVSVLNSTVIGGTTGIFMFPDKVMPLVGGLIQGNKLYSQDEESIAFDGIGNDAGAIPVVANGKIASASNDAEGRLVVSLDSMVNSYAHTIRVSSLSTWKNFYFAFGAGTGLDGNYVKICGFDTTANTLTLDTVFTASNVILTGDAGVESGFFNWTVRENSVSGTLGNNNIIGTALSMYLNVFGMIIENNTATNCAHGVDLAGGVMINGTRTFAYNNIVRNNTFTDCNRYGTGQPGAINNVVGFNSFYGNGPLQFNNQFTNNTVNGGRVFFERQRNFVEIGNTYNNVTRLAVDVQ